MSTAMPYRGCNRRWRKALSSKSYPRKPRFGITGWAPYWCRGGSDHGPTAGLDDRGGSLTHSSGNSGVLAQELVFNIDGDSYCMRAHRARSGRCERNQRSPYLTPIKLAANQREPVTRAGYPLGSEAVGTGIRGRACLGRMFRGIGPERPREEGVDPHGGGGRQRPNERQDISPRL
jgi:hypothetical protein